MAINTKLENMLGREKFDSLKESKIYNFSVEAFALNSFSYLVMTPIELGIAGMDMPEHLWARLISGVTNTLTARPYGIFRDYVYERFKVDENSSRLKKYITNTISFTGFQLPIYCLATAIGGAEFDEIAKSAGSITVFGGFLGGPYGVYLDYIRDQFEIETQTEVK